MNFKIDHTQLRLRCSQSISDFTDLGKVYEIPNRFKNLPPDIYIHADNGKKILAVAHLDTVQSLDHYYHLTLGRDEIIFNAALDDRLGVYLLLDVLPKLGIEYDILLTTGEESGHSSAAYFDPPRQYKWMFSFDRAGTDVVMYQYEDEKSLRRLRSAGFRVGGGTYSCIAELEHLGCKGFNIGTAYYQNHSNFSYANVKELHTMVGRFCRFYNRHRKVSMRHDPPVIYLDDWRVMYDYDCYCCNGPESQCGGPYTCLYCGSDCCHNSGGEPYDDLYMLCVHCANLYMEGELEHDHMLG